MDPTDGDLMTLHDRHHDRLRERLFTVLERLVAVDVDGVDGAAAEFARFEVELEEGLQLEELVILPCYREHGPTEGQGKADIVDGDHVILRRGIAAVKQIVAPSSAGGVPRALRPILEQLPHVYRLLGTLEHHTDRERKHVYPVVAHHLDDASRAQALAALSRLVDVVAGH